MFLLCFVFFINISTREAHVIMVETTTSDYNFSSDQSVPCSANESSMAQCLNGGKCFKPSADSQFPSCKCSDDFEGESCGNRVLPIFDKIFANKIYLVLISLTLVSIIISIIVFVSLAIKKRRREYIPWTEERQNLK